MAEKYSLLWLPSDQNGLAERFFVPGYKGKLPFLITGTTLDSMEKGDSLDLSEWHLLSGILYGLYEFDNDPKPWHIVEDRDTLTYLIDVLGKGFNAKDPESLILNVASRLREEIGNEISRIVLLVGLKFLPFSFKIRSDMICDIWAVASSSQDYALLDEIPEIVGETNLKDLLPDAAEIICYYGLCALVLLNRPDEIETYLNDFVYPNVSKAFLKKRIKDLLMDPNGYSANDLKVV